MNEKDSDEINKHHLSINITNPKLSSADFKKNLVLVTMKYEDSNHSQPSTPNNQTDNGFVNKISTDLMTIDSHGSISKHSTSSSMYSSLKSKTPFSNLTISSDRCSPVSQKLLSPRNIAPIAFPVLAESSNRLSITGSASVNSLFHPEFPLIIKSHKDSTIDAAEDIMMQTQRKRSKNVKQVSLLISF
jgi:hypothetical protein